MTYHGCEDMHNHTLIDPITSWKPQMMQKAVQYAA